MNAIKEYRKALMETIDRAFDTQEENLRAAAELLKEATLSGHNIFGFGCSHAALPILELYYRTGGMATINPVRAPGLCLDVDPATMTSQMERMRDYGRVIADSQPISEGDVIIVHSVSGRNNVYTDVALRAKEKGAKVIVLTNLTMSKAVASRHPDGLKLYEVGDVVIDNCGCIGDAAIRIPGVPEKVAPTSTAVAAALLNAVMAQAVALITEAGAVAPVFVSANVDGGDEHNKEMLKAYGEHIFYM